MHIWDDIRHRAKNKLKKRRKKAKIIPKNRRYLTRTRRSWPVNRFKNTFTSVCSFRFMNSSLLISLACGLMQRLQSKPPYCTDCVSNLKLRCSVWMLATLRSDSKIVRIFESDSSSRNSPDSSANFRDAISVNRIHLPMPYRRTKKNLKLEQKKLK